MSRCHNRSSERPSVYLNATMKGRSGPIGRFSSTGLVHRWEWRDDPWPPDGFDLAPDEFEPPASARWSDIYRLPPEGARRPFLIAGAERLYSVAHEGTLLAFVAISGSCLHWVEVVGGTLDRMGAESLVFRPVNASRFDPMPWSRTQNAEPSRPACRAVRLSAP